MRRFATDKHGNVLVEFAMLMPVFAMLLVGTFELAVNFLIGSSLEAASAAAARYGTTGQNDGAALRQSEIERIISEQSWGLIDMEQVKIETLVYRSFSEVGAPEPIDDTNGNGMHDSGETYDDVNGNGEWDEDMGLPGLGGASDIVVYRITYPYAIASHLMSPFFGDLNHQAMLIVQNEPY